MLLKDWFLLNLTINQRLPLPNTFSKNNCFLTQQKQTKRKKVLYNLTNNKLAFYARIDKVICNKRDLLSVLMSIIIGIWTENWSHCHNHIWRFISRQIDTKKTADITWIYSFQFGNYNDRVVAWPDFKITVLECQPGPTQEC